MPALPPVAKPVALHLVFDGGQVTRRRLQGAPGQQLGRQALPASSAMHPDYDWSTEDRAVFGHSVQQMRSRYSPYSHLVGRLSLPLLPLLAGIAHRTSPPFLLGILQLPRQELIGQRAACSAGTNAKPTVSERKPDAINVQDDTV